MLLLLYQVCRIAIFRAGPQHLPNRLDLLVLAIIASWLIVVVMGEVSTQNYSVMAGVGRAAFALSLHGALLYALLAIFKKKERFIKVATAWYGVQALVNLVTTLLLLPTDIDLGDPSSLQTLAVLPLAVPAIWYLVIAVYLIKESLDFNIPSAILTILCLEFITLVLVSVFFGDASAMPSVNESISLPS